MQVVQKYIAKNDSTGTMGKKYHTNPNCTAALGLRLISAPDSLLKHYGITDQCKLCEQVQNKPIEDNSDIIKYMPLLSLASKVIEKQLSRSILRSLCMEYRLPYTLRTTKLKLAKSVCRYWIMNHMFDSIQKIAEEAINHWQDRIDVNDRHKPYYYQEMKEACEQVIKKVKEVK